MVLLSRSQIVISIPVIHGKKTTGDDSLLPGKPLAVGGWTEACRVITAFNYEARAFGVHYFDSCQNNA